MKTRTLALLLPFLFLITSLNAQHKRGIPNRDFHGKEDFNGEDAFGWSNWTRDEYGHKADVKKEALQINNSKGEMQVRPIHPQPGFEFYYYDFQLAMDITFNSSEEDAKAGFFILSPTMNGNYLFAYITSSGKFSLTTIDGQGEDQSSGVVADSHILIGKTNRMELNKKGLNYQIIINGTTIYEREIDNKYWGFAYYSMYFDKKQKTTIDNFDVLAIKSTSSAGLTFTDSQVPDRKDYQNASNNFSFLYNIDETQHFTIRESKDESKLEIRMLEGLPEVYLEVVDYNTAYFDSLKEITKNDVATYCVGCGFSASPPVDYILETGLKVVEFRHELTHPDLSKIVFIDMYISNPATNKKIIHLQSYGLPEEKSDEIAYFAMKKIIATSLRME